ncbi:MAG: outer membrane protein insertion porin family [Candidatus Endobugula sp.]|jgi:outer membrane protein insertion porin family
MHTTYLIRCVTSVCLFSIALLSFSVSADTFRVDDIRIDGLQRVSAKAIFAVLPIEANSDVTSLEMQDAVRKVFKTEFFSNIDIAVEDNVLVLNVVERPAVSNIAVAGNSVLDTEALLVGLKNIGLAEGEIFKQSALDKIERELNAQYSDIGRYATKIQTKVIDLEQNQVNVAIKIIEGEVAEIKHVNIVGNKQYKDEELKELFEVKETGRWSWVTGNDQYANQKLAGDLEGLKTFYLNRGYLEFETTSTQVSLSPDKESVYITINIFEGKQYEVSAVDISGDPIISIDEVNALVSVKEGDTFSQERLFAVSHTIEKRLGDDGYSYAKVSGVPELNKDEKSAKITFFINPGSINYVRRIVFRGNVATQDNVLRREMRQLEGAPVSVGKLQISKLRLQRLPLFSDVIMTTEPIPGSPDQIDVVFTVVELPSGSINASLGFSQGSGISFGAGLQQSNWLGTGNTFGFQVDRSDVETGYSVNFSNPYYTQDGVSRGVSLFYRERNLDELDIASFSTDRLGVDVTFGYPISENSRISFGVGIENIKVTAGAQAVQEVSASPRFRSGVQGEYIDADNLNTLVTAGFADSNGNGFRDENDAVTSGVQTSADGIARTGVLTPAQKAQVASSPDGFLDLYGNDFNTLDVKFGWTESTLNRGIFPTNGGSQKLKFDVAVPGSDIEYYRMSYDAQFYRALTKNLTLRLKGKIGYADSYGSIEGLPFFENFFSGGSNSIRGFETSSLGPKGTPAKSFLAAPYQDGFAYVSDAGGGLQTYADDDVQTIGGNMLLETGVELAFPLPFTRNVKSVRTVLFVDAGNVFSDNCASTQVNCSNIDLGNLSSSAGVGIQWLSPVGPLSMYISKSIQEQPSDKTESFQFSLGQSF